MIIPMKQKVWVTVLSETETDRYGRPIKSEKDEEYKARVRRKQNRLYTNEGAIINSDIEIDVLPHTPVNVKNVIKFENIDGGVEEGIIEAIEDSVNLSGNKIYFRTLQVNGT